MSKNITNKLPPSICLNNSLSENEIYEPIKSEPPADLDLLINASEKQSSQQPATRNPFDFDFDIPDTIPKTSHSDFNCFLGTLNSEKSSIDNKKFVDDIFSDFQPPKIQSKDN